MDPAAPSGQTRELSQAFSPPGPACTNNDSDAPAIPPSPASTIKPAQLASTSSPRLRSRTASHSLSSASTVSSSASRKGKHAKPDTSEASTTRASISMPLPPARSAGGNSRPPDSSRRLSMASESFAKLAGVSGMGAGTDRRQASSVDAEDSEVTPTIAPGTGGTGSSAFALPDPVLQYSDNDSHRMSFSSLYSFGSVLYGTATNSDQNSAVPSSGASAPDIPTTMGAKLSTAIVPVQISADSNPIITSTTATTPLSITTSSSGTHLSVQQANVHQLSPKDQSNGMLGPSSLTSQGSQASSASGAGQTSHITRGASLGQTSKGPTRSRSRTKRRVSSSTIASSSSPSSERQTQIKELKEVEAKPAVIGKIGVCALDVKARSKPSRNILNRLIAKGEFEVVLFGDKVILDEEVENWPVCDFLISFFSAGFPLEKAIAYAHLRRPFCVNDLPMQHILWDRRICLRILDKVAVPTPKRIEVNRDGGPRVSPELAVHLFSKTGVRLEGPDDGTGGGAPAPKRIELVDNDEVLNVDGVTLRKPFVEKPTSGEDHNIRIYYPKSQGGGGRKLFRKIGNKSSEWDPNLSIPKAITDPSSSYVYEQFLRVDNSEDVKAYTVGTEFVHAETRKSPVVDGLVRRNTHGKEIRYITSLNDEERSIAAQIADAFGQTVCGFDMLRVNKKSYVIDVNGWSFVKDNNEYYDKCASILRKMFIQEKERKEGKGAMTPVAEASTEVENAATSRPTRKNTGHRSALQSLLSRSPSISRLTNHRHHTHQNSVGGTSRQVDTTAPDQARYGFPLSSPPSFDRNAAPQHQAPPKADINLQPSPVSTPSATTAGPLLSSANSGKTAETAVPPPPDPKHSWKLKGMVVVIRHADRTPKQKFKFTFHTKPFIDLLKGHQEEVLLVGEYALNSVMDAVKVALKERIEDPAKLKLLRTSLARKGGWPGTKVQIKPMFRKRKLEEGSITDSSLEMPLRTLNGLMEGPGRSEAAANSIAVVSPPSHSPVRDSPPDSPDLRRPVTRSDSLNGVTLSRISAVENNLILDKLQLIIKWGGEPTHSARYQSQDLGENMRNDMLLMNRDALEDVAIYTSSERRVTTSAQIWASSFLDRKDIPEDFLVVRKDLLDDSNAAKDEMDRVKKKLKLLLREGNQAPPQFAWPKENMPEPSVVLKNIVELMKFHRRVLRHNYSKLFGGGATSSLAAIANPGKSLASAAKESAVTSTNSSAISQAQTVANIQARWCCGEDAELFRERWEKLFAEFCDTDKVDPSKISELYDTMKYDALHNRQFLESIFTPSSSMLDEDACAAVAADDRAVSSSPPDFKTDGPRKSVSSDPKSEESTAKESAHRLALRRRSMRTSAARPPYQTSDISPQSYFNLFTSGVHAKAKMDVRLEKLRELYKLAKVLFDFVGPQEYGITDGEKLEIGLLTSLPLLKEIVRDLEEVQASEHAKSFVYFTKESHIYTLLNCIVEGGIQTKIERSAIPELDYLSQICFELYESENKTPADAPPEEPNTFAYSIRISISPGCHTYDPLDVQLDSKHCIGCAPRRSLTPHLDWKEVIGTLRDKFQRVKLPKSFLAVNLSEKMVQEEQALEEKKLKSASEAQEEKKLESVSESVSESEPKSVIE